MSNKEGTSWIQTLNKEALIEELGKRGIVLEGSTNFNDLRESLRNIVKKELRKASEKSEEDGNSEKKVEAQQDARDIPSDSSSGASKDSAVIAMSDGVKLNFTLNKDDWETYVERLEMYFIAHDVKAEKKAAQLLTRLDEDAFKLVKQLVAPDRVATKTYADLIKTMSDYLAPKPSEVMERCKFNLAKQETNESVADFTAKLKKLSLYCNFADIKMALRDQFVCGLRSYNTKIALFKMENLDYDNAVKEAVAREAAEKNASNSLNVLEHKTEKSDVFSLRSANKVLKWDKKAEGHEYNKRRNAEGNNTQQWRDQSDNIVCYCCGRRNHISKECRFRDYKCRDCGRKGHLQRACRRKDNGQDQHQVKLLEDDERQESTTTAEESTHRNNFFKMKIESRVNKDCVWYEGSKGDAEPMFLDVRVNSKQIRMEIDTGTFATVTSELGYDKFFKGLKIEKTANRLRTYDNSILNPVGKVVNVQIEFNGKKDRADLFVLEGSGPTLIGRQWLNKLGLWPLKLNENFGVKLNKIEVENVSKILFEKFQLLFSDTPGQYNKSKTKLHLREGAHPVALKCNSVAHALKPLVENELDRLLELGHIEPVEISEWATPIIPVFKSNNSIRLCGNFKLTLNPFLIMDKYPLHTIDEIFSSLQGGALFSELDLKHAYMQFPVAEECRQYLTIITHKGLFRYKNIPEGVSPAPADVQRKMDECLRGINSVITYIDNVYVTGKTEEEHMANLLLVCKRLQECGLRVNKHKSKFFQNKIEILGFVIDRNGLHKAKSKVDAIVNAPKPSNQKELSSFLGLAVFYDRFLSNRSLNLKPLYDLQNSVKFNWNAECDKAFEWVKNELISPRVLAHYDQKEKLLLACDASDYGISAILSHRYADGSERPIAFASKRIAKKELNRTILDKEAMAIVFGFKRFFQYVFGKTIILRTDNKALQYILGPRKGIPVTADNRLQRYTYYLSGFRYTIEHVNSKANANCDALSRLPIADAESDQIFRELETEFSYVNFFEEGMKTLDYKMLAEESKKDKSISQIIKYVMSDWPNEKDLADANKCFYSKRSELTVDKGCLFWGLRAAIPTDMQKLILNELHATHLGIVKIKMLARSYVWWPTINSDIESLVKECKICLIERKKPPNTPLTTWPWPTKAWSRIHCDFAKFYGNMYLIIVDAHSKWPEIINFQNNTKAYKLIEIFKGLFARYGLPLHCVTDGGPQFRSEEFHEFLTRNGVKHTYSPPYHPATNGAAENFIQTFKDKVHKIIKGGERLDTAVYMFLFDYRSIEHCTTRRSPAFLMYNRELRTRFDLLKPNVLSAVDDRQRAQIVGRKGGRQIDLQVDDDVLINEYGRNTEKRGLGKIVKKTSPSTYAVLTKNEVVKKRHVDQIVKGKPNDKVLRRSPRLDKP
ncbi:uncharacterized protein K02A2.6-like [Nylanderia fulva]|uniref:uncharacterized protein K02A2.6-like n=1 Tax=Nylanderia fulva TaxID=613905 RepID=UPI0010FB07A0|nr:uncharacterized protein K02A2.6-like [Nylanderia fulva]